MNKFYLSLLAVLFLFGTKAQDSLQYQGWTDGGATYSIHYKDGYLFTGNACTFMVHEATGQPPYNEVFRHRFVSNIDDIQSKGDYLYIAANHSGLSKWDISDPANPVLLYDLETDNFDQAAYDISFYGQDTIFLTYKRMVAVIEDNGSSFNLLTTFGDVSPNGIIRGGCIKDSLYAYAVSFNLFGNNDGIYIVNANDLTQYSYTPQTYAEPEEILPSINSPVLNVLGGTHSWTNPLDPKGCFYSLDISDPYNPVEIYYDTVNTIWGLGISAPMNGVNINDTLYVATNAAMAHDYVFPDPAHGHVYIWDVSNPSNIHLINSVYAGLWHFDLAIQDDTLMHIASEWYGIETMNISDLANEQQLGQTWTGGWNWGTGVRDDRMVVCNGGYGFKVFDISDPSSPLLINENFDSNFVKSAEYSEDGQYLFAWYFTQDGLRVFETTNYTQVASLGGTTYGHEWTWRYNDILMSFEDPSFGASRIHFFDISDPLNPSVIQTINYPATDMQLGDNGKLFVTHNDSISVWDLDNNFQSVASYQQGAFQQHKACAVYGDTVYAYVSGIGLVRYLYDGNNTLIEDATMNLPLGEPKYMAADEFGLYLCYTEYGLYMYDKVTLTEVGYYEHGLEFIHPSQWGPRDLFCKDDLLFLVEWYGQTTILTGKNGFLEVVSNETDESSLKVFPNPSKDVMSISFSNPQNLRFTFHLYGINGQLLQSENRSGGNVILLQKGDLHAGLYVFEIQIGERIEKGKIVFE